MQTGGLNVGSAMKTLPVFSSTASTALPLDVGIHVMDERPKDVSSLMAKLPSHAVTSAVLNSEVSGSNANVLMVKQPSHAVTTAVLNSAVTGSNLNGLMAKLPSHAVTTSVLGSEISGSNANGLMAKLPSHAVTTAVLNSAVNGSNTNGHSDVDHYGLHRNDADHYGHYHSSMHHHDEGVHISNGSAQSDFVQVHGEGFGRVHGEGFGQVHGEGFGRVHSEGLGRVHSDGFGRVHSEGFGRVHSEGFGQVHGEGFGQVHGEGFVQVHGEGCVQVHGEGFGQVHGAGQHISTVLVEDHSEHVHESGCKCDLCYMNLNEVTNASDVVFYDSETSHHSRTLKQHFVKDIGTKVRIYQRTPRVKHVQETILVPELCYEERPIVLTKNRVVMVDVEEIEMVPIIKEVKKMKKIIVHKIHEERRNQTCSEPVIEYVRRGTMVRIPRVYKVEEDVEIKVPVIRRVQERVKVEVPTGEWIENPIEECNNVSGKNVLNNAKVEAVLVRSRYVEFVLLRLDPIRGHSVALIAANQAALERWAKDSGVGYSDFADLCSKQEARKEVLASLIQVAREGALESFEIPKEVRLYRRDVLNAFMTITQTTIFNSHSNMPATCGEIGGMKESLQYGTQDGKVEAVLVRSAYVDFVILCMDSIKGHSAALIAANQGALERWAKDSGVVYSDFADLCSKPEARKEVLASLVKVAREGALESSANPTKVRLYRGDVLISFLTVAQTTKLNSNSNTAVIYSEIRDLEKLVKYRTREGGEHAKLGKVEAVLVRSRYADFVRLRRDSVRGHIVALVAANQAALERWAKDSGVGFLDFAELCSKPEARKEVLASLIQVAREASVDSSVIPAKVRLYRGDVLNAFLTVTQTTVFSAHSHSETPATHVKIRDVKELVEFGSRGDVKYGTSGKVEAVLVKSRYVDFVLLRLDSIRGHSVALIAANQAALERWAKDSGVGYSDFADLCSKREARKEVMASLLQVAREGALESSEIPTKVRLYRGDVLNAFITVAQTTIFNSHSNMPATYGEIGGMKESLQYGTQDGKVEAVLVRSAYVDFVILCMDSIKGHSAALIAANQGALERWAKDSGVVYSDFADLCSKPEARKEVLASLVKVAREGALESSANPTKVRLYRGDVLISFLTVAQTTKLNLHLNTAVTYWEIRDVEKLVKYRTREGGEHAKLGKVEAVLVRSRYADFVRLRRDSVRGHIVALVAANQAALERWAKDSGVGFLDFAELCSKPEARKEVLASLIQVAREGGLESAEIPAKVRLYRGDLLNAFLAVTQTTKFNSHSNTSTTHREVRDLRESVEDQSQEDVDYAKIGKVEAVLVGSPYVDFVMLRLDSVRGPSVALIAANQAALERWAKDSGVGYSDFADLCLKPEARKEVLASLIQVASQAKLEGFKIPSEVALLADREDMVTAAVMLTHMTRGVGSTAPPNERTSSVQITNEEVSRAKGAGIVTPVQIINEEVYLGSNCSDHSVQTVTEVVNVGKGAETVTPQDGENAMLRKVEAVIKRSPYVDYVMIHPDPIYGHYVARVVADQAALVRWAKDSGVGSSDFADLCSKPEARKEVLNSVIQVAREGGLERFEIPTEVALVAEQGDLVTVALTCTQKTILKQRADDFYSRFLNLTVQEKGSRDVDVLDKVFHAVNMQADKYTSLGKVEGVLVRSPYVDYVMLHLDPVHGHCVALVVANQAALEDWAKSEYVDYSDFADLCSKPVTRKKVLASVIQVAREGELERFEIPKKIALLADRGDLLNVAAMLSHMTRLKQRESNLNKRFLKLRVHDKESRDVEMLDKVLDAVNMEAGEYGRLGKVETVLVRSPYVDNVMLHLDPIDGRCVALILANRAPLEDWAKSASVAYSDFADLCSKPEARKAVFASVIQVAREGELERFEIPMEVVLLAAGDDLVTAAITRKEGPVMTEGQVDLWDEEWGTGSVLAGWAHQQIVVHD